MCGIRSLSGKPNSFTDFTKQPGYVEENYCQVNQTIRFTIRALQLLPSFQPLSVSCNTAYKLHLSLISVKIWQPCYVVGRDRGGHLKFCHVCERSLVSFGLHGDHWSHLLSMTVRDHWSHLLSISVVLSQCCTGGCVYCGLPEVGQLGE